MTSRNLRLLAAALLITIVQYSLMSRFTVLGVHPDLLLAAALCVAISGGPDRGAIAGFVAGLLVDVPLTSSLGASALIYCVIGFIVGRIVDGRSGPFFGAFGGMLGSAAAVILFLCLTGLTDGRSAPLGHIAWVSLVIALINACICSAATGPLTRFWVVKREYSW